MRFKFNMKERFNRIFLLALSIIIFLGLLDLITKPLWGVQMPYPRYWNHIFWTFSYAIIIFSAIMYHHVKKDKSETFAFIFISLGLIVSLVEDLGYFLWDKFLNHASFPPTQPQLDWLHNIGIMNITVPLSNIPVVSFPLFIGSVIIGVIATYFIGRKIYYSGW